MEWLRPGFRISDQTQELQLERVHHFLSHEAYWSQGLPMDTLKAAIAKSFCFGVFDLTRGLQVGFARVVSDQASFAWVCDVYVEKEYRGQGLALWLMETIRAYPPLQGLRRWCLATRDAHDLYRKVGFEVTQTPESWMEIKNNNIYLERSRSTGLPG